MHSYSTIKQKIIDFYTSDKDFLKLLQEETFPLCFSAQAPSASMLDRSLKEAQSWQAELKSSPLRPFLIYKTVHSKNFGTQEIVKEISFPSALAFEEFVLKNYARQCKEVHLKVLKSFNLSENEVKSPKITDPIGTIACFQTVLRKVTELVYKDSSQVVGEEALSLRTNGLLAYVTKNPKKVSLLGAVFWKVMLFVDFMLVQEQTPHVYLRQIALPQIDTKFLERHYPLINELLINCLPKHRQLCFVQKSYSLAEINNSSQQEQDKDTSKTNNQEFFSNDLALDSLLYQYQVKRAVGLQKFLMRWGFKTKPDFIRLRSLDDKLSLGEAFSGYHLSDVSLELSLAQKLNQDFKLIIVCENETSYLTLPPISKALAIFGGGYAVSRLSLLPIMYHCQILYFGDIDTHGFAILHELRLSMMQHAHYFIQDKIKSLTQNNSTLLAYMQQHVISILMDTATLLAYPDSHSQETDATNANLHTLTNTEQECYLALVEQKYGKNLRLEQELLPFTLILEQLEKHLSLGQKLARPPHCS